jgi:two-component system, NtrC family, response regulator AtoC
MNNVFPDDPPRVAIVDDDASLGAALVRALSPLGFKVWTFRDGAAASEWLEDERVDAVVMDLHLRSMSGWEFLENLRARHPHVAVLIQSSNIDVPGAISAVRAGAFDVLEKPIRVTELQARLFEAIALKRAATKSVLGDNPDFHSPSQSAKRVRDGLARLLGNSPAIARVREQVRGIARFNQVSTLVIGETGTGKEVVAEALHSLSAPDKPFVTINCAAIPDTLFESELFGHEAGSFTGARTSKPGLFETVGEGTLLLDEVGEMALSMQPKLLRVLQTRTFRRVGGAKDIELRARIVSTTNRKLSAERQDGMRSDLYFRLAGFTIVLPPLRHRPEDIDLLANHFLLDFAAQYPGVPSRISAAAAELMLTHPWSGNVRELKRVVEQAAVLCTTSVLDEETVAQAIDERRGVNRSSRRESISGSYSIALSATGPETESVTATGNRAESTREALTQSTPSNSGTHRITLSDDVGLNELQQKLILDAYEANAHNLTRAARALRIPRTTLRDRLKRYGCL